MTEHRSSEELLQAALALGRIFRLMARPYQPGDIEQYEAARAVVMATLEPVALGYQPSYARDRLRGAQGDLR